MNYTILSLIILGLWIGSPLGNLLTKLDIKKGYKSLFWYMYIGIYFSFVSVYLPFAIDKNYVSKSEWTSSQAFLFLIPFVSILFFTLSRFLKSNKSS
jgi:hypothetical protein